MFSGCVAYAVSVAEPLREALAKIVALDPQARLFLYSDDIQVWVAPAAAEQAKRFIAEALALCGLCLRDTKTAVWCPKGQSGIPTSLQQFHVDELKCLGARLVQESEAAEPATPAHGRTSNRLAEAVEKVKQFATTLVDLQASGLPIQTSQALFRHVAHGAVQHIVATVPLSTAEVVAYDAELRRCWERILQLKLSDVAWAKSQLPLRDGGLASGAVHVGLPRAAAAFSAMCSRVLPFVASQRGMESVTELLDADDYLSSQIYKSVGQLEEAGLNSSTIPWSNGDVPRPFRQGKLVRRLAVKAREMFINNMDDLAAARWRSCSGAGSSGFLLAPLTGMPTVENTFFRIALAKRFGGGIQAGNRAGPCPCCCHIGRNGPCTEALDPAGIHPELCMRGGYVVRSHNRLVRWLADWLRDSRAESDVALERKIVAPDGRMDVVVGHGNEQDWIDVAIVSPSSSCSRSLKGRARKDGDAARAEEGVKRRRYGTRVSPFVIEAGGRPGASARSILMRHALPDCSDDVSCAWRAISNLVQADRSLALLTAWGGHSALESGLARIFIP